MMSFLFPHPQSDNEPVTVFTFDFTDRSVDEVSRATVKIYNYLN